MTEENQEEVTTPAPEEKQEGISNADLKSNSTFQKVTGELAQLRQEKADREAQEADSKAKAETEKLEAEGNYKAALELKDKQLKEQEAKHAKDILKRDLKTELVTVGFKNQTFLKGAIAGYEGETDGVAEYVKELASDESNKALLGEVKRTVLNEAAPAQIGGAPMSVEQAKEQKKNSDPKIREQAYAVLEGYFNKHGNLS